MRIESPSHALACHGCGSVGPQQGVSSHWLCSGCVQELAAWALAHGAVLAPHIQGNLARMQEDADGHTNADS